MLALLCHGSSNYSSLGFPAFGFMVAQITSPDFNEMDLDRVLGIARKNGIQLVYWATHQDRVLSAPLLHKYDGKLVDQKVTFKKNLTTDVESNSKTYPFKVFAYPKESPPQELRNLAVAAGEFSRFKVDGRIPREGFKSLYEKWMEGSTLGRLADVVLVASSENGLPFAGMITLSRQETVATIGLIAVHEKVRGQGVGSLLIQQAHLWMISQGVTWVSVVTQLANHSACGLYQKWGYRRRTVKLFTIFGRRRFDS